MSLARFFGFPVQAAKPKGEDDVTPVRKRTASKNADVSEKKKRMSRTEGLQEGEGKPSGPEYDEEKEEATRKKIQEMEEASEAEKVDIDAIYFGMTEHMEKQPKPCSETSIKSYAQTTKSLFKRDSRSFSAMSTKEYHGLIKSTYENKKVHSLHAAAIAKFMAFYADTLAENDGKFMLAPRWIELAKEAQKTDERGLKLRSSSQAEQYGTRYVGIHQEKSGRWVATYRGQRYSGFSSEEAAVQAIWRAQRGLSVHAVGTKPLNWARAKKTAIADDGQSTALDLAMTSLVSALPFDDGTGEITEVARSVSVIDPVSLAMIETPVRGKQCRHLEVFDKATYIEFNEMKAKMCSRLSKLWNCPVCGAIAKPDHLVVVPAFVEVLSTIQGNEDISQVDVMPDGRLAVQPGQRACSTDGVDNQSDSSACKAAAVDSDDDAGAQAITARSNAPGVDGAAYASHDSCTGNHETERAPGKSVCAESVSCTSNTKAVSEVNAERSGGAQLSQEQRDRIAAKRKQALSRRKKKDQAITTS